eukprot:gnl/MRDRNA2_/MRDRNA2_85375_c0_seq1.p1 gnl/MRDRNA2_/MRDRNA2_85375_c0~~gnl/MRDRNA2_/MRDRNA2_85375_c0_seq1.p1  ORF type:complete len:344 (+),score=62.73 gnl/MRDRNA2_/MRDRNA2_85375_c0_seq1:69-1100(+)
MLTILKVVVVSVPVVIDVATAAPARALANFIKDSAPFGNMLDGVELGQRQGFALSPKFLEELELELTEIPLDSSLERNGVEVIDLQNVLNQRGVFESNCDLSEHKTRMALGQAMIRVLEQRFDRQVIHLADTSAVSGGAIYSEATVRNTSSTNLRNSHRVIHMDKNWAGISQLINSTSNMESVKATIHAQWPWINKNFAKLGYSFEDYQRLAHSQSPGMLNFWVALTPGHLVQQPIAVGMKDPSATKSPVSEKEAIKEQLSTMHVHIKNFNDTISVVRSSRAADGSFRWGFRPNMPWGQALLFYTDRTPHGAVWLKDASESASRASAEIRVLVTDRPRPLDFV